MHLYILARGIKHEFDRFVNELSAKYLPMMWKGKKDENKKLYNMQVSVRPIQLFEVVFPKEHEEEMVRLMEASKNSGFAQHQKGYEKLLFPLRKALKAKKLDKKLRDKINKSPRKSQIACRKQGVQTIIIGRKDDEIKPDQGEQL